MGEYFRRHKKERMQAKAAADGSGSVLFTGGYDRALAKIREEMRDAADLVERSFTLITGEKSVEFHIDGLIEQAFLQRDLLPALLHTPGPELRDAADAVPMAHIKQIPTVDEALTLLLSGYILLVVQGWPQALGFEAKGWEKRSVEESRIEWNIRGPHEGFNENLRINTALLRKRLRTARLKFKELTLGARSPSLVTVAYLEDLARPELVARLMERLQRIEFDAVQTCGHLEQLTVEHPNSPFPQFQMTERPDKVVAGLLEGRLAVLLDGMPIALLAPVDFFQFFQTFDDYSSNWLVASPLRFLRILAVFVALLLPSFYIALLTFHYEAIPWSLLIQLAEDRARVPFPPVIEALIMELFVELLREAAIRLPSHIGLVIGIVGGLVIGQAAVAAGIVSNVMIIVVGATAIASFIAPSYDMGLALRLIRFPVMILSAAFGVMGVVIGGSFLLIHLLGLESLGQPYFSPLAPLHARNLGDAFIRAPYTAQGYRPPDARPRDDYRGKGRRDG